jgi:hypothetical protein
VCCSHLQGILPDLEDTRCRTPSKFLYLSTSQHCITPQKTQIFSQNPELSTVTLNPGIPFFMYGYIRMYVYYKNIPFWTNIRLVYCILIFKLFLSFIFIPGLFLERKYPNKLPQSMKNAVTLFFYIYNRLPHGFFLCNHPEKMFWSVNNHQ